MSKINYFPDRTGLLLVDPYSDFLIAGFEDHPSS
jgi:hypothetical protein